MDAPLDDLDVAVAAARAGAAAVEGRQGMLGRVEFKGEVDPVTDADRESQAQILATLRRHRPHDEVLAEESTHEPADDRRVWLVDPLDGTVNFLHGVPHVGVSIALYEQGGARVGVVIDVFRHDEYTAFAGKGAWLNGRPMRVSQQTDLGAALVATGFPYDRREHGIDYGRAAGIVLTRVQGIRRFGTASLDLAWVAAGRYDAYWELKLAPWDVAAGLLLVHEAGGRVTDLNARPAAPGDLAVVATNGLLHPLLLQVLAEAVPLRLRRPAGVDP